MRSRWLDAAAILGGALAIPALAWLFLVFFAAFAYGSFEEGNDWVAVAFLVFTLLTVPIAVLMVWTGNRRQRGIAAGLLLGWAALGIWVWMGIPGVEFT
jgi:hypothetical protein